jgi:hypothetical protein
MLIEKIRGKYFENKKKTNFFDCCIYNKDDIFIFLIFDLEVHLKKKKNKFVCLLKVSFF